MNRYPQYRPAVALLLHGASHVKRFRVSCMREFSILMGFSSFIYIFFLSFPFLFLLRFFLLLFFSWCPIRTLKEFEWFPAWIIFNHAFFIYYCVLGIFNCLIYNLIMWLDNSAEYNILLGLWKNKIAQTLSFLIFNYQWQSYESSYLCYF